MKKIYLVCGDLTWVGLVEKPTEAIKKALEQFGKGKTLDPDYFYLDEHGLRIDDARWKVPVEQALTEAGYILDDIEESEIDVAGGDVGLLPPPKLDEDDVDEFFSLGE